MALPKKPEPDRTLTPRAPLPHARGTRSTRAGADPGAPPAAIPVTPAGAPVPVAPGPRTPPAPAARPAAAATAPTAPIAPTAPAAPIAPAARAPVAVPAKAPARPGPGPREAPAPVARPTPLPSDRPAATIQTRLVPAPGAGRTVPKPVAPAPRPPAPVAFPPPELAARCEEIAARYPSRVAALIPVLHLAQRWNGGWVSPELEAGVARWLGVSDNHVRGVLTFYTMFHTKPVGRHHVEVCRTLSCWLRGAEGLTEELRLRTGLRPGETDPERRITVAEVECLGLCEAAPAVFVDGEAIGSVTRESLGAMVDRFRAEPAEARP